MKYLQRLKVLPSWFPTLIFCIAGTVMFITLSVYGNIPLWGDLSNAGKYMVGVSFGLFCLVLPLALFSKEGKIDVQKYIKDTQKERK